MRQGFTLLEITIGMALVSIILGMGAMFVSTTNKNEAQEFSIELKLLAKSTLEKSTQEKRPYLLLFQEGKILQQIESGGASSSQSRHSLTIPDNLEISLQRSGTDSWSIIYPARETSRWSFSQSGICEPISLKIESSHYSETLSFHPLTAGIRHEER